MHNAVDYRRGHLVVPEYRPPAAELQVRRDGLVLVHRYTGQVGDVEPGPPGPGYGQGANVADLVNDDQGPLSDLREQSVELMLGVRDGAVDGDLPVPGEHAGPVAGLPDVVPEDGPPRGRCVIGHGILRSSVDRKPFPATPTLPGRGRLP